MEKAFLDTQDIPDEAGVYFFPHAAGELVHSVRREVLYAVYVRCCDAQRLAIRGVPRPLPPRGKKFPALFRRKGVVLDGFFHVSGRHSRADQIAACVLRKKPADVDSVSNGHLAFPLKVLMCVNNPYFVIKYVAQT